MTWIKTVPAEASEELRAAIDAQRLLYPVEYSQPGAIPRPTAPRASWPRTA
jgi:hypothetical protein